jgi:hypothetical protein
MRTTEKVSVWKEVIFPVAITLVVCAIVIGIGLLVATQVRHDVIFHHLQPIDYAT